MIGKNDKSPRYEGFFYVRIFIPLVVSSSIPTFILAIPFSHIV